MSTGETPPSATARFTSPSTTSKKYPGTPKSPMLNTSNTTANVGGNRNSQARQRLLSGKISAPRPINLPSLRREHAVGTEVPSTSPATSHGWGSASCSPSLTQSEIKSSSSPPPSSSTEKHIISPTSSTHTNHKETAAELNVAATAESVSPPVLVPTQASTTRAWAVPTVTETKVQASSTDFPTAAEAASTKKNPSLIDDKEYLKYASSDPNHTSWDEMVSEDLDDFSVDVVEFDDGTRVQVEADTTTTNAEPVLPSDRFTNDYDRSYPPKSHYHEHHTSGGGYKTYRRSEDHGYNSRSNYDNRRHSTEGERRYSSSDRWSGSREYSHRRPSYDRKYDPTPFQPTSLLQRPRRLSEQSVRSDHSQEHINPLQIIPEPAREEITVAQKNLMLTAAERAKKRLDEQEAEYKAAAERARQKAAALAEQQKVKEEEMAEAEKTILKNKTRGDSQPKAESPKVLDTSKPWNLVAAKVTEKKSIVSEKTITKDQQNWDNYVSKLRTDEPVPTDTVTSSDWNSFATRLQESESKQKMIQEEKVEVLDYAQNEELGTIPAHLLNGRTPDRTGWVRNKDEYRSRGKMNRTKGNNRIKNTDHLEEEPVVVEILKKTPEPIQVLSKKTRLTNLLKESTNSIFPEYIEKLAGKKPANMSFMVDTDESDRDITMMGQETSTSTSTTSTASTPPKSAFQQNPPNPTRINPNPNFPVLVYQYPVPQQQSDKVASKGVQQQRPMGVYLMPQHQYVASNQYMVPYPQTGTQPVYFPTLPWQQQPYSNSTSFDQRRPFNNNQNGYRNNCSPQRGNYRKRGHVNSSWSGIGRGRGNNSTYHGKRYNHHHAHHDTSSPPSFEAEPSVVL